MTDQSQSTREMVELATRLRAAAESFEGQRAWHANAVDGDCEPHDSWQCEMEDGSKAAIEAAALLDRLAAQAAPGEPVAWREEDDETIARRLATIEHGDDVEWMSFLTKAHHWMSLSIDAAAVLLQDGRVLPQSPREATPNLHWLVDWVHLYATEGNSWIGTPEADRLIALAGRKPTQADADHFEVGGLLRDLAAPLPRRFDETTKSAPASIAPHNSGEHLPSSDAAVAGADTRSSDEPPAFYGAQCPSYPACTGGCGLGCTHEIEQARAARPSDEAPSKPLTLEPLPTDRYAVDDPWHRPVARLSDESAGVRKATDAE